MDAGKSGMGSLLFFASLVKNVRSIAARTEGDHLEERFERNERDKLQATPTLDDTRRDTIIRAVCPLFMVI